MVWFVRFHILKFEYVAIIPEDVIQYSYSLNFKWFIGPSVNLIISESMQIAF